MIVFHFAPIYHDCALHSYHHAVPFLWQAEPWSWANTNHPKHWSEPKHQSLCAATNSRRVDTAVGAASAAGVSSLDAESSDDAVVERITTTSAAACQTPGLQLQQTATGFKKQQH